MNCHLLNIFNQILFEGYFIVGIIPVFFYFDNTLHTRQFRSKVCFPFLVIVIHFNYKTCLELTQTYKHTNPHPEKVTSPDEWKIHKCNSKQTNKNNPMATVFQYLKFPIKSTGNVCLYMYTQYMSKYLIGQRDSYLKSNQNWVCHWFWHVVTWHIIIVF